MNSEDKISIYLKEKEKKKKEESARISIFSFFQQKYEIYYLKTI